MIKANELRKGVLIIDYTGIVREVYGEDIQQQCWYEEGQTGTTEAPLNPIPLSPEWLERCGFEAQVIAPLTTPSMWVIRTSKGYNLYLGKRDFCFISDCDMPVELNSLHQLQNLYFALTGEELNVKL